MAEATRGTAQRREVALLHRLGRARQPQDDGEDESELRVGEDDWDRRTSEKEQGLMQRRAEAWLGPHG
jgi:hypothetical protein